MLYDTLAMPANSESPGVKESQTYWENTYSELGVLVVIVSLRLHRNIDSI